MTVPRLKTPIGDYSGKLPIHLQNALTQYLQPRPFHQIVFESLAEAGVGGVHEFMKGFDGLLKAGVFSNQAELKREYMNLGRDYTELKQLIDWIDNEKDNVETVPDRLPGLTPQERQIVVQKGRMQRIQRGTRLIKEGDHGSKIFFLIKGSVDLFRKNENGKKEHICQLGDGHVFGEYGAFLNLPRNADVVTTRDCDVFILDVADLKDLYLNDGSVFDILKERVFLFKNLRSETGLEPLPFPVIRKFFDDGEIVSVNSNETLFEEGDWGHSVYFILDGDVHILKDKVIKRTLKRGDFFGEIALLKKTRRSAGARSATPCTLLTVDHVHFLRVLSQNLSVALRIENVITERIRRF